MKRFQTHKPAAQTAPAPRGSLPHRVRIIGGQWRGRTITFPPLAVVRPSPDRVRETVFNWLQMRVPNARCLDLFAGSGALGIEALSRGAAGVVFVDREAQIGKHLRESLQRLGVAAPEVEVREALQFLQGPVLPFDIVFLDPPFSANLLPQICTLLDQRGWLAADALIYLECPADLPLSFLPSGWSTHRSKRAGQVGYHLLRVPSRAMKESP